MIGLLVFLAQRGLRQSRLILVLLVGAVAAGVAFQIPNTANALGYRKEILVQGVEKGSGDVRVRPRAGPYLEGADALAADLVAHGFVAATPALFVPGAVGREQGLRPSPILGVDARAARLPYKLLEGEGLRPGDGEGVVLGSTIAHRLGVRPGDRVRVRAILGAGGEAAIDEDAIARWDMTVRGIAAGSFVTVDAVIVDRAFLAGELGEPGAASILFAWLADHFVAREAARAVEAAHPEVEATPWMVDSPFLDSAIASAGVLTRISAIMVVLAVLIPVWALLYIHVLHRQRQIGQLVALGLGRGEIFAVYLLQAVIVGVAGVAIGCAGGLGLVRWFSRHPIFSMEEFVIVPQLGWGVVLVPVLLVLGATVVAGVVPAWRASRIDPARMLRGVE